MRVIARPHVVRQFTKQHDYFVFVVVSDQLEVPLTQDLSRGRRTCGRNATAHQTFYTPGPWTLIIACVSYLSSLPTFPIAFFHSRLVCIRLGRGTSSFVSFAQSKNSRFVHDRRDDSALILLLDLVAFLLALVVRGKSRA